MTTKITPASFWSSDVVVTDDNWTELENAAQVKIARGTRARILEAMTKYVDNRSLRLSGVRPGQINKPILQHLKKVAEALSAALQPMISDQGRSKADGGPVVDDGAGRIAAGLIRDAAVASPAGPRGFEEPQKLFNLRADIVWLAAFAADAIEQLPKDRGAPSDPDLDVLIRDLVGAMKASGWKGPQPAGGSPFMKLACELAGKNFSSRPFNSPGACAQRVKEALSDKSPKIG